MSHRRVSRQLPILVVVGAAACIDDAPTAIEGHGQVNLAISADVVGTGSELVEIGVSYLRGDGGMVRLPVSPDSIRLTTGATIQQPATVDVTPCLSDPASAVQGGCQLSVNLRLLDGTGTLMDSATFEPSGPTLPGQTVTMPTVSLAGCGPMVPLPTGPLIVPFVPSQGSLKSLNGNTPTTIQFVNGSCEDITVRWIDYDGGIAAYYLLVLAPGQSHTQQTWVTHPWLIADANGRSTLFMPTAVPGVAYIPRSLGIASTVPVATLTLATSSDTIPLPLARSRVFTAVPKDAQGNVLIGRTVTWSAPGLPAPITMTSTASGATFTATGTQLGPAKITATSEGTSVSTTIQVSLAWQSVSTTRTNGIPFACGVIPTGQAYCWGSNFGGNLGNGSADTLAHVVPEPVLGGHSFVSVDVGSSFACGLTTAGNMYCWGLGFGATPVISGNGLVFRSVSTGNLPCGVTTSGVATCFIGGSWSPYFSGLSMDSISSGFNNRCGLATDGNAFCDGFGGFGALGNGTFVTGSAPAQVLGGPYTSITAGGNFACALDGGGTAYCWGAGGSGQLGVSPTSLGSCQGQGITCSPSPVAVAGGLSFKAISSAGATHACGISISGIAYCWGENTGGQLGDGSTGSSSVPVPVSGNLLFNQIAAGNGTSCGVTVTGEAYCWGFGFRGVLGNGSTSDSPIPVRVVSP